MLNPLCYCMKKNTLGLLFLLLFFVACKSDTSKIPVLSNDELLRIDDELYADEDTPSTINAPIENLNPIDENLQVQIEPQNIHEGPQKLDKPNYTLPYINFADSIIHLNNVEEDSIFQFEFKFENLGRKPLEIKSVEPTCACTLAETTFLPLKTNEQNSIKGSINTQGKAGKFYTTILVHSNAENSPTLLKIQGKIIAKAKAIE